ncbi:MAG: glycosyltransferase family 4 protein [Opitutales bacterium]|nr:glycosyltransferase family 4 protein [Opitutales bacterium]
MRKKFPCWELCRKVLFFVKIPFCRVDRSAAIRSILRSSPAEIVLDFLWDAALLRDLPMRKWILTHELIHQRARSYRDAGVTPDFTVLDEAREVELLENADGLIAIQDEDAAWMRGHFPTKQIVVLPPPCARRKLPPPPAAPPSVLFIGGKTAHNRYGLEWLAGDVWPHVLSRLPDARLRIYGTVPCGGIASSGSIEVKGPVAEVSSAYAENQVAAVPFRFGSGLKIKLLEAMSIGLPAVATPIGAQGFADLRTGLVCPVYEDAPSFSDALVRSLTDTPFRKEIVAKQDAWLKKNDRPGAFGHAVSQSYKGLDSCHSHFASLPTKIRGSCAA